MKSVANLVSYVFHPLLMPSLFHGFLFFQVPGNPTGLENKQKLIILVFILATTFVIPVLATLYLKHSKVIKSLQMRTREERVFPFVMTAVIYMATTSLIFFQWQDKVPLHIPVALAVISMNVLVATIITFFWKISIHSVGIGGLVGMILSYELFQTGEINIYTMVVLFVLSGIVMSARLFLSSHQPKEVYSGYVTGFVVSLSAGIFFF